MIDALAGNPLVRALGFALLHFVWQGAVIGVLTALSLAALKRHAASLRYLVACAGLVIMLGTPVGTWWAFSSGIAVPADVVSTDIVTASTSARIVDPAAPDRASGDAIGPAALDAMMPVVVGLWGLGVLALSARLLGGCLKVEALRRRATMPLAPEWRIRIAGLAGQLGVTRGLCAAESSLVDVPTVIGWLRPLILVPASALGGLSPSQLEAILAHEIAHVRRHDYLVNVLQHVIETLFFYHPAVWWVSRRIRIERELCCDDLAVAACGDRLTYASALTSLEELRVPAAAFGLSATGGDLLSRVRRIVGPEPARGERSPAWAAIVIVLALSTAPVFSGAVSGAAPRQRSAVELEAPRLQRSRATATAAGDPTPQLDAAPATVIEPESREMNPSQNQQLPEAVTFANQSAAPSSGQAMTRQAPLPVQETVHIRSSRMSSRVFLPTPPTDAGQRLTDLGYRRPGNGISFPRVVREQKPTYTPAAMANGVQGAVALEVVVMENGTVGEVRVVKSLDPTFGLDDQAVAAARQWMFEPARDSAGIPVPVVVSLELQFTLSKSVPAPAQVQVTAPAGASVTPPRKIRTGNPSYPAVARQAGVEGTVVIEALTDVAGRIVSVRSVRSIPLLDEAAMAAVRQWEYTPALVNDTAVPLVVTATFHFSLADEAVSAGGPGGAAAPLRVGGAIQEPRKLKNVFPVYPQEARDAGIQGMVILEAVIDEGGNVVDARVIRSVPMLDEAALSAVRQWKYTPPTLDGVPKTVIMTVTVNFTLN
jgi:TonB family protein